MLEKASGKPVVAQANSGFSGYATIETAPANDAAHVLLYKGEMEADLPYLSAFQCGLALRSIQAAPQNRFDLASTSVMGAEVQRLIEGHVRHTGSPVPASMIPQLCSQLGHGLGLQLRSMPIAIRVDQWLYRDYPALATMQRRSVDRQLQDAMDALGPTVRACSPREARRIAEYFPNSLLGLTVRGFSPKEIIDANAGMSCAFAKSWAETWGEPEAAVPFISAGYGKVGDDLLDLVKTLDPSADGDRELVNQWAERLGLARWFLTIDKT